MHHALMTSFSRLALQVPSPVASTSRSLVTIAVKSRSAQLRPRDFLMQMPCSSGCYVERRSYATASTYSIGHFSPAQPKKARRRVGRGPGSGRGKTSTRGHKGQKARAGNGKPTPGFEGGQTTQMKRYPKRGFINTFKRPTAPLNIGRVQDWIKQKRLDPSKPITVKELYESRCIHNVPDGGVQLLGGRASALKQAVDIVVSRASSTAIQGIEASGGSITCKYYTPLSLRALIKPEKWLSQGKLPPNEPLPVGKKDLMYYSDINRRGYLAKLHLSGKLASVVAKVGGKTTAEVEDVVTSAKEAEGASIM